MGYTHYWSRPKHFPVRAFEAAAADCRKVVEFLCRSRRFRVQYESDDPAPPVFDRTGIRFNGEGEDGHETFSVPRVYEPGGHEGQARGPWFGFCKTAAKPYDAAVCACLIVLRHHFGERFGVSSDGEDGDEGWALARQACQRVLGYGGTFTLWRPPRLNRWGLAPNTWSGHGGGGRACRLSNGWELVKPRPRASPYAVYYRSEGERVYVCGAPTAREAVWLATLHYFRREFRDAPLVDSFLPPDLGATPGEWTPFLVWADKLQEDGHEELAARLRKHLPRKC